MATLTRTLAHPAPRSPAPSAIRVHGWTWAALVGYLAVVVSLTCLKAYFTIGLLWRPENQRVRELRLQPFGIIGDASTTFGAAFDILGNVAFFVPVGLLLMTVLRRVWLSLLVSAGLSLTIEVAQYVFSLGRTDITDLICNTAGALTGALVSSAFLRWSPTVARRWTSTVVTVVLVAVLVFTVLVILGPSLGDPDKVVG